MTQHAKLPRRALIARIVIVVLVTWLVTGGVLLLLARQKASSGLDALQQARDQLTADALLQGKGRAALEKAERDFASAHDLAANPVLAPWELIPILGRNVSSVRSLTASADQVSSVGATAARDGSAALAQHPATGQARLVLLRRLSVIAERARRGVAQLDAGPSELIGPVATARARFADRLSRLRTATAAAATLAAGAEHLLRGPSHYLVLAANNGEMRAGSGMFLSAGVASFDNGSFTIGPMVPTPTIDTPPGAVPLTGSLASLWGWLSPNQSWRNLATTPRFDETAPLAATMWQAVTGQPVDGVLAVDPEALKALLAAQGPVQVGNRQLSAENVVSYLLLAQYDGIPAVAGNQASRFDQLSSVARASVNALAGRPWQAAPLISQLAHVGKGRHILAWSKNGVEQKGWEAAGIAGQLKPDSLAVSIMNFGGTKLDQFLSVDATVSTHGGRGGRTNVRVALRLKNTAPNGLSGYVAGPYPGGGAGEGVYQGILGVDVPGAASFPSLHGAGPELVAGLDGPSKTVAAGYFQIPRGQTRQATVDFVLPPGFRVLEVQPSARVPPITWHFSGRSATDVTTERLAW